MKRISSIVVPVLILCLFVIPFSYASVIIGKVTHVADGDTITVRDSLNQKHRIRLYGIDCPESGQEFGREATRYAARLTAGKKAEVIKYDKDRYGRVVGVVMVDGVNVNQRLIEQGYAWKYGRYCKEPFCRDWRRLEEKARNEKIGLWNDDTAVAPWDWRRNKRDGKSGVSKFFNRVVSKGEANRSYSGNVNSRVFHGSDCKHYDCKNCLESFTDRNQAKNKGYKPCKICSP
ncbi:thermonuclease family protein [Desulfosediminicola ganghwensis]|uniref:thermonuclease family protein n=1 Tax=Desulfosediminicola ganghwensis TaxID=2569540 RepID=UPI0010AC4314|nr:thermonuclease family protein [Desulfosediminicola ganghwensis]